MSGECDNCGHHTTECCCHEPVPAPNLFQNFNDAMRCVIERGGKAWRPISDVAYQVATIPGLISDPEMQCIDRETGRYLCSGMDVYAEDLTATDWAWSEPESAEEAS